MTAVVTEVAIQPGQLASDFYRRHPHGAVISFVGFVRDLNAGGPIESLFLECYADMASRVLSDLGAEARRRFNLKAWHIVHRFGELTPEDPIVFVAASADHRRGAFLACEFLMDALKTQAPFWKQERSGDRAQWVTVNDTDVDRQLRWNQKDPAS